ncbi:MAG: hypothetical protein QGH40_11160 [bacterium]|nr:hypothetical protein [bacterium]
MRKKTVALLITLGLSFCLLGCGGTIGEIGGTTPGSAAEYNSLGWESFEKGSYSNAEKNFSKALQVNHSQAEYANAYTGLGWTKAKVNGIRAGISYFEKAKNYNHDARVGLGGAFLSSTNKTDYENGVFLLEQVGLSSLDYVYKSAHDIGVTNAEAHAILGILYYYTGNEGAGLAQIQKAKELDDNISSAVDSIADEFIQ